MQFNKEVKNNTIELQLKKIGFKVKKTRWPRAKYGTQGRTYREAGIKNLHFAV